MITKINKLYRFEFVVDSFIRLGITFPIHISYGQIIERGSAVCIVEVRIINVRVLFVVNEENILELKIIFR